MTRVWEKDLIDINECYQCEHFDKALKSCKQEWFYGYLLSDPEDIKPVVEPICVDFKAKEKE